MKETTVQVGGMVSIFDGTAVQKQIKRRELDCWKQRGLSTASSRFTDSGDARPEYWHHVRPRVRRVPGSWLFL